MAAKSLEKLSWMDAQLRLLAPERVSEADKLMEYDALLLDRILDVLLDLHGKGIRETVQESYELSAEYEGKRDPQKLEELGNVITSLDPGIPLLLPNLSPTCSTWPTSLRRFKFLSGRRAELRKKGDFARTFMPRSELLFERMRSGGLLHPHRMK